jgi:hypothetical protein
MPPLALEEYAAIAARLLRDAGRPPADVLAELSIPVRVWQASAAAWEQALDDDLARGDGGLLSTFAARFIATRAALGRVPRLAAGEEVPAPSASARPAALLKASQRPSIPEVPDIPILPGTAAVDRDQAARPALPFSTKAVPRSPDDEAACRAAVAAVLPFHPGLPANAGGAPCEDALPRSEPTPWLRIEPTTARLDARWLPPPPEQPAQPPAQEPIPLLRVKSRSRSCRVLLRLWSWLWGRRP